MTEPENQNKHHLIWIDSAKPEWLKTDHEGFGFLFPDILWIHCLVCCALHGLPLGKLFLLHTIGICFHNVGPHLPKVLHVVPPPIWFKYIKIKQNMRMDWLGMMFSYGYEDEENLNRLTPTYCRGSRTKRGPGRDRYGIKTARQRRKAFWHWSQTILVQ